MGFENRVQILAEHRDQPSRYPPELLPCILRMSLHNGFHPLQRFYLYIIQTVAIHLIQFLNKLLGLNMVKVIFGGHRKEFTPAQAEIFCRCIYFIQQGFFD